MVCRNQGASACVERKRKRTNDPTSRPCCFDVCRVGRLQRRKSVGIYAATANASSQEDCCKKASDI
jgi:hypothetical protein